MSEITLTEEQLLEIALRGAWNYDPDTGEYLGDNQTTDSVANIFGADYGEWNRTELRRECWRKVDESPVINTSMRGLLGRLTGMGYEVSSHIESVQEVIDEIWLDYRNRLWQNWTKFLFHAFIDGELYPAFTVHEDGFVEVDYIDPYNIEGPTDENHSGIIAHPRKKNFELGFVVKDDHDNSIVIPSINIARNPELWNLVNEKQYQDYDASKVKDSRSSNPAYRKLNGFFRFIVPWNRSLGFKRRDTSYLRTVLKWINYYEMLKKYEIDHKRSAGSFLWTYQFDDLKAWKLFINMTDEELRKSGIGAKPTPGAKLYLPPGVKVQAVNPTLPKITESDNDIFHMITSGLNEPEDVTSGQSKGTFASVKASRGPMSDRVSDEVAYADRWTRYEFWGSIFFLKAQVGKFPRKVSVEKAVGFKNKEPIVKTVMRPPESEDCLEISYPVSEVIDVESRAKGFLGVKHASTSDTLGISKKTIASKLGIGNYRKERLRSATEDEHYPELLSTIDQEGFQESRQTEPPVDKVKERQNKEREKKNADSEKE